MPGAERLRDSQPLTDLVAKQKAADKFHAAICATPAVAFEPQGEGRGQRGLPVVGGAAAVWLWLL